MGTDARFNRSFVTVAAVLAAGESRRMGSPKALVELEGRTFLERIVGSYRLLGVPCCVVLGREAEKIVNRVDLRECKVLINTQPELGPLSSFRLALDHAPGSSALLLHPVDHPLAGPRVVEKLLAAHRRVPSCVIVPAFCSKGGHPALFPRRFYPDLQEAPLDQGARWVIRRHLHSTIFLPVRDAAVRANLNEPGDLKLWWPYVERRRSFF